ncbi:hypothetical protein SAPIO_CDS6299 [Scedosporium apiospermum]|uniref:Uncharacterized protein n=1 Tax=Pseudallescheria apiosperma TaxID=563466 RepID=A0A084G412_PSEDA|nr:uncharacterized protein SAPIO_CDS6299 [Scedosporium apiospermum]KEZ42074.1 hypothetical protein SAPIO_CDS6299 [Scedosporium apiospermum]
MGAFSVPPKVANPTRFGILSAANLAMTEAGLPHLEAIHKPVRIDGASLLGGQIKTRTRGTRGGSHGSVVKKWKARETEKGYTWKEISLDYPGEAYWAPYQWQLEAFIDRKKGRPGTGK